MIEKNKKKMERRGRPTWTGYYTRKTPTKVEKLRKAERKHKGRGVDNDSSAYSFTQKRAVNTALAVVAGFGPA